MRPAGDRGLNGRAPDCSGSRLPDLATILEAYCPSLEFWDPQRFQHVALLQEAPRNSGCVELVEDLHSGRHAAVKAMPVDWVCESHQAFLESYPEENELPWCDIIASHYLSSVAGLRCVCQFIGLCLRQSEEATEICLVLSYCAGGDLFSWLERCSPVSAAQREAIAMPLMFRVLEAVRDIHAQGMAHGDLSLENVLLLHDTDDPDAAEIKIIDFGAATASRACGLRGKPSYQAPEVHRQEEYDAQVADAFSVGVMIFVLTVGNYPWKSTRPHCCPCFKYCFDKGFLPYLARRTIQAGDAIVSLDGVLSPELISLLSSLLATDSRQRLTVERALEHPWFLARSQRL